MILIGQLYPAAYRPACPDLNSSPKTPQRTLLPLPLMSSQPNCVGRSVRFGAARSVLVPPPLTWTKMQLSPEHMMTTESDQTLVRELRELIAALDRRVPRIERKGEHAIARDAQGLRRAALKRLRELE
jgi:hypothetical protein